MVEGARLEIVWAEMSRRFESSRFRQEREQIIKYLMSSVFTKIINGEIPCYKIYEDDKTLAFLDIEPEAVGHTLVVPKLEVEKVYDLPDDYYQAVMATVKKLAQHYEKVLGKRITLKVVGVDVPHAHVHILPADEYFRAGLQKGEAAEKPHLSEAEMRDLQAKLRLDN